RSARPSCQRSPPMPGIGTAVNVATVLVGAILALLVWRQTRTPHPAPIGAGTLEPDRSAVTDPYAARVGSGHPHRSPRGGSAA
ncbi:MAG: hypothetical protein U1C73_17010, partial [Dietzia sp.]|nr:hypothetical protein [Dietzia sp.]